MLNEEYCLFTVEHPEARRVFIRGIADITQPLDDYDKIIKFYENNVLQHKPPKNPFEIDTIEHQLFDELLNFINSDFEHFGDELTDVTNDERYLRYNQRQVGNLRYDLTKVVI